MPDTTPTATQPASDLLPHPDRIRARLAELAREQRILRTLLRTLTRSAPAAPEKGDPDHAA
jgi:hypothetical protein